MSLFFLLSLSSSLFWLFNSSEILIVYELVGHEVTISSTIGAELQPTNEGIIEEVGEDYIVIKPCDSIEWLLDSPEEYSQMDGHWFVELDDAMPINHFRNCKKCLTSPVT